MKILAFTDTHNDPSGLAAIIKKARQHNPEVLVCCGDLSNFGVDLLSAGRKLSALRKKILMIPGNHESPEEVEVLCRRFPNFVNIHERCVSVDDVLFCGYGTGGFALRDAYFEKEVMPRLKREARERKMVFVTHPPIFGTRLDFLHDAHRGNKSMRKFITEAQPALVLCGHFHENEKKKDRVKQSVVLNPGFDGMIIEV